MIGLQSSSRFNDYAADVDFFVSSVDDKNLFLESIQSECHNDGE
jgi:hypothetical protein